MLTDYKFKLISRDGNTTKCRVAFSEGGITTENEPFSKGGSYSVTRYRRSKLLRTVDFEFQGNLSDGQLRLEMNKELGKDPLRIPIDVQT